MTDEVVPGMAEAIEARRKELNLSPGQFAKDAGVTPQGLRAVRRGFRRNYQHKLKVGVARALRWQDDSIDRLLAGDPPVELPPGVSSATGPLPLDEDFVNRIREAYANWIADLARRLEHPEPLLAAAYWMLEVEAALREVGSSELTDWDALGRFLNSPWGQDLDYLRREVRRAVRSGQLPDPPVRLRPGENILHHLADAEKSMGASEAEVLELRSLADAREREKAAKGGAVEVEVEEEVNRPTDVPPGLDEP